MNKENEKIVDLKEMLDKSAKCYGNKTIYKLENKEISYVEMQEMVNRLGTSLLKMGLKDKKIAIISENRYEWEIAYFAIACGTGIVVPLDKSLTAKEISTILKRAEVEAIFCSEKYEKMVLEVKKDLADLKYIISFDNQGEREFSALLEKGKILIENGNDEFINAKIDNEATGFIMFTSGTTEKSKAIMLSHKNVCSDLVNVGKMFPIDSEDIALSVLPLNHVLEGLFCMLLTIYRGAMRIYCKDMEDIVEYINKYKISFMGAVPAIYEYMYKRIDEIKKDNIKIFMSGGAQLEVNIEQKFQEKGINLVQGYGMTETSPVISMSNINLHKIGAVGKAIPNTEVKIVNKDEDGIGEIAVKGENIFLGYYQDIESTEKVLKDGWLYTGDLAQIDNEGYIFLCGRLKNVIVLPNGKKVFPEELEMLINKINGVKESLVFEHKIENKVWIYAEIVCEDLKQKQKILEQIRELNKKMPQYKNIKEIYITKCEILKTATGKIKRKEEIDKVVVYSSKQNENTIQLEENDILENIKEILHKQLGIEEEQITTDTNIYDLGADSLDKVEIILAIEKEFNIKIPKEITIKIRSVKDIMFMIKIFGKCEV